MEDALFLETAFHRVVCQEIPSGSWTFEEPKWWNGRFNYSRSVAIGLCFNTSSITTPSTWLGKITTAPKICVNFFGCSLPLQRSEKSKIVTVFKFVVKYVPVKSTWSAEQQTHVSLRKTHGFVAEATVGQGKHSMLKTRADFLCILRIFRHCLSKVTWFSNDVIVCVYLKTWSEEDFFLFTYFDYFICETCKILRSRTVSHCVFVQAPKTN